MNTLIKYEIEKKKLEDLKLTPDEYDRKIKIIIGRLGV